MFLVLVLVGSAAAVFSIKRKRQDAEAARRWFSRHSTDGFDNELSRLSRNNQREM